MHTNDLVGCARKDAMDVEGDRLSSLPDDLIHKIFSYISIKDAIGNSVLSTRWRFIWTSMPYLNFENLTHMPHISEFISNVLSHRDKQIQVSSVNLLLGRIVTDDESVTRVLDCARSHNVQQLSVKRAPGDSIGFSYSFIETPTWDLPFLTTLHLHCVKLSDDNDSLFSKCTNLKNLFLKRCHMKGTKVLNICHPRLSNLTLKYTPPDMELDEVVNVVAPQLKNLTINRCEGKHLVDAPGLTSLVIEGFQPWQLYTPGFHSLEKVRLHMYDSENANARKVVCLLQQLGSVKLLTLNLGILQCLFSIKMQPRGLFNRQRMIKSRCLYSAMELNPHKACAFANTKILKFIPNIHVNVYLEVRAQEKVTTSSEIKNIKNYDTSPSAIFPMVSREELTATGEMESAQIFVKHLRLLVNQCKANSNSDTDKAHMDEHGKPQVEMHWTSELQLNIGKIMALIENRKIIELENCRMMASLRRRYMVRRRRRRPRPETHPMIEWLQEMLALFERTEGLISQLSASKKGVLQPMFLSFCEDAAVLTNNMFGWMKTAN